MKHKTFLKSDNLWTKAATNRLSILKWSSDPALFERFSCLCSYLKRFRSYDVKCFFLHSRIGSEWEHGHPWTQPRLLEGSWTQHMLVDVKRVVNMAVEVKETVSEAAEVCQHNRVRRSFVNTAGYVMWSVNKAENMAKGCEPRIAVISANNLWCQKTSGWDAVILFEPFAVGVENLELTLFSDRKLSEKF